MAVSRDEAAKMRFGFYEHFLRNDVRKAPAGGANVRRARLRARPQTSKPPSGTHWTKHSQWVKPERPAHNSSTAGSDGRSDGRPSSAPPQRSPLPPSPGTQYLQKPRRPGAPSSPQAAVLAKVGGGGGGSPASSSATTAAGTEAVVGRVADAKAVTSPHGASTAGEKHAGESAAGVGASGCASAACGDSTVRVAEDGQAADVDTGATGCFAPFTSSVGGGGISPGAQQAVRRAARDAASRPTSAGSGCHAHGGLMKPAHGSIYHHLGEAMLNPGPGHYADAQLQSEAAGIDPDRPQTWSFGQAEALTPENLDMFNTNNAEVGPGRYAVTSALTEKQPPRCCFARTPRTPGESASPGRGSRGGRLPVYCHQDPRFTHQGRAKPQGQSGEDDQAFEQGLATRSARAAALRFDSKCQESRLDYHGAAFRLGGNIVIPSGHNAGPSSVPAPVVRAREERMELVEARARRAQQQRARPQSARGAVGGCKRSHGFSRALRF